MLFVHEHCVCVCVMIVYLCLTCANSESGICTRTLYQLESIKAAELQNHILTALHGCKSWRKRCTCIYG